jgi:hypothetical protein
MHNEHDVSRWHYSEKVMLRKKINNEAKDLLNKILKKETNFNEVLSKLFECVVLNLYALFSGYGENPVRAFCMLILLLSLYLFCLMFLGLKSVSPDIANFSWNIDNILKAFISGFEMILFKSPTYYQPSNVWGNFIKISAQILIYIQTTLLVVSH